MNSLGAGNNTKPAWRVMCARKALSWEVLSLHDWLSIFESILLMSCNQTFCEQFGRECIALSHLRQKFATFRSTECRCRICCPSETNLTCPDCGMEIDQSATCPKVLSSWNVAFLNGNLQFKTVSMGFDEVPASLSDEKHCGHVAWKCCKLLDAIDCAPVNNEVADGGSCFLQPVVAHAATFICRQATSLDVPTFICCALSSFPEEMNHDHINMYRYCDE